MAYVYTDAFEDPWQNDWNSTTAGGYGYGYGPRYDAESIARMLAPLIAQIRQYDNLRVKLEKEGGRLHDLNSVTDLLSAKVVIGDASTKTLVSLADPAGLRTALFNFGNYDIHLEVRRLSSQMPVYYLCRTRHDYWSEHSLIVEDLYRSPGYPLADERFVRLMDNGHETYFLRLTPFRERIKASMSESEAPRDNPPPTDRVIAKPTIASLATAGAKTAFRYCFDSASGQDFPAKDSQGNLDYRVDNALYDLGRHIFQAAWHEDQRPGFLVAEQFDLPHFRQAIELLYLCLSGELCELRSAVNAGMLAFFKDIYPQPALHAFLKQLPALDGGALSEIPRKTLKLYAKLSHDFSRFLRVEVPWGHQKAPMPLYKLVFGNFSRLELVAMSLKDDQQVKESAQRLEHESQAIIAGIVGQ